MAQKAEIRSTLPFRIQKILSDFWGMALIYLLLMFVLRILELVLVFKNHVLEIGFRDVFSFSILDDFGWNLYLIGLLLIFHILASLFSRQFAKYFSLGGFTLALIESIFPWFLFLKNPSSTGYFFLLTVQMTWSWRSKLQVRSIY